MDQWNKLLSLRFAAAWNRNTFEVLVAGLCSYRFGARQLKRQRKPCPQLLLVMLLRVLGRDAGHPTARAVYLGTRSSKKHRDFESLQLLTHGRFLVLATLAHAASCMFKCHTDSHFQSYPDTQAWISQGRSCHEPGHPIQTSNHMCCSSFNDLRACARVYFSTLLLLQAKGQPGSASFAIGGCHARANTPQCMACDAAGPH